MFEEFFCVSVRFSILVHDMLGILLGASRRLHLKGKRSFILRDMSICTVKIIVRVQGE